MLSLKVLSVFLTLGSLHASAQSVNAIEDLFEWVKALGGEVNVEVKTDGNGVRGLYAAKPIATFDKIASIPAAAIINGGSLSDTFAVSVLTVLRELKDPYSRFKPYINMWPTPSEVLHACNMDSKYVKMFKAPYWERSATWETHLQSFLRGELDADSEYTIREMVGNTNITLEDLQYACAIAFTRSVTTVQRPRLLYIPIFDLANHERLCPHFLSEYVGSGPIHFQAGRDIQAGEQICYSYGALRDDYAVAGYGFLPELEDPPRLALVDHPEFDPEVLYSHDKEPSEEPFHGEPAALEAELRRLLHIYDTVKATPDPLPPRPKGTDYVYDLMKELEARRVNALAHEIRRLSNLLGIPVGLP